MLCNLSEVKITRSLCLEVRNQMRYNRNLETRKKVILFLMAFRYRNISLACLKLGYQRSYLKTQNSGFYFWFNRLKGAGFDIQSLVEQPRRPFSHPKMTPLEIVDKIISLRKQTNYGPDRLQFHLEQLYNLHLPKSTIGHILKGENLIPPKRLKHRKKHTKRYQMPNPGDKVQADVKYVPYRIHAQQHYQYTAIDDPASGGGGDSLKSTMGSRPTTPKTSLKNL